MSQHRLKQGAWAGVISFSLTFLTGYFAIVISTESSFTMKTLNGIAVLIDLAITAYFLSVLAELLGRRLSIPGMSRYLQLLILATIILGLSGVAAPVNSTTEIPSAIIGFAAYVTYGILLILIGLGLQRWAGDVFGLRQALGTTALVSGILFLTLFGVLFGIVGVLIWTVMAIMVLFRAARAEGSDRAPQGVSQIES